MTSASASAAAARAHHRLSPSAYGLFQLVHGPLGDRIGKLRAVSIALVLTAVACAACRGSLVA